MIALEKLSVFRNKPNSLDLEWKFEDTSEDLNDYEVSVYVSQAPSQDLSEYNLVDSGISANTYAYEDFTPSGLAHGTRQWYYKLKIENTSTQEESITDYYYLNNDRPNLKWLKIWKHKDLVLRKKSGRDFFLLKRRTWGTRCEVAWDPVLFKQTTEVCWDCNCWGTGWREGYFKPQKIKGMVTPAAQVKDIGLWGEFYPSDVMLTTLNRPPLETGDVIVDAKTDKRYFIQQVRTLELLGVTIEQQAQLSVIHIDDEIYEYSIEDHR